MVKHFLSIFVALTLLSACETASNKTGDATGSATSGSSSGSASSSTTDNTQTPLERELAKIGTTVLFDFDSAQISDYAQRVLDRQAAFLKASPEVRILIGGHADERGTREYNLALGERRAASVRDYLVAKGVNSARLRIISYGKERPKAVGSNEASWRQNRRSESVIN